MPLFEWDVHKEESNIEKHGDDFTFGAGVWECSTRIDLASPREHTDEGRRLTIGEVDGVVLAVAYVNKRDVVRIISVRDAHRTERRRYRDAQSGAEE